MTKRAPIEPGKPIRILAAEEIGLVRSGLVALFGAVPDMTVVAVAEQLPKVVPAALEVQPDVTVLSVRSAGSSELEIVTELAEELPQCRVLILAGRSCPSDLRRAVASPAYGYLPADVAPEDMIGAVRRIARGERVVDSELAFLTLAAGTAPLTPRELDVLRLAAEGGTYNEIARLLCLSIRTVRNHMSRVIGKTGARNRVDAIRIAENSGWL